uniref:Uncharacterized protein n=1 Tax=Corethron hystrix TaxID=216773 RepID=A0A7S1BQA6_9STRA|mmetsp:Transcript_34479/g.79700  ORF Transcript_34479/g.79700 Transcript_34479/m.79700 type:complete len:348 (+) Transcript_34479:216-1259(+)|eukprot:CAMPEP_0113321952 /NCGR_PEP_ID=MMETSP0010_2-20120614/15261_1 /TAXON_ID=216773 ORGANISM="Corethron hystrix, Strain 308" /NCGR_SAMPLE_ID=MMETSP0010_2 /ASSEMBLY_ACC=CAM_ASM_000155 /LENGTH=347 /DNA_ID=CAMNT_0000180249 /DNA_START=144 /DNA_END=1187 /DNA_ORIENTATION=- /assembly_acc=CAM_ASM_000155
MSISFYGMLAIIIACAALVYKHLEQCLYKINLFVEGLKYMALSKDKKWRKPLDPSQFSDAFAPEKVQRKTFVFVRHGESAWNDVFNKGPRPLGRFLLGYGPTMAWALGYELYLFLSGAPDSLFYDSPLSPEGLDQVHRLGRFLAVPPPAVGREKELLALVRGDEGAPTSMLLASNLRRAVSTVAAAFSERIARKGDKIVLHSDLQEISRNVDALSIIPPDGPVEPSFLEKNSTVCDFAAIFAKNVENRSALNRGNKPLNSNGLQRMRSFCDYAFGLEEEALIIGGHSLWFREFFRTFLPYDTQHVSKRRKLVNAGCVTFTVLRGERENGALVYMIDPKSIEVIYGGF